MNILFVSCLLPYPTVAHGGGVDLFHLIASLSARHEIHLVSIADESEQRYAPDLQRYCASVQVVVPSWTWKQKLRWAWYGLWTHPLMLGRRARAEIRLAIQRVVVAAAIDVAQFEWTETAVYANAVPPGSAARVLDEVDVSYRPLEYRAKHLTPSLLKPYTLWRSHRAKQKELRWCRQFDAILTRSEYDRQALRAELPGSGVEVFHPWTHLNDLVEVEESERQRGRLLFVGAMDRDENSDAVLYFYRRIFPDIRQVCPGAEFWIVGANPQARVQALAQDHAVRVTGYVDSLRPYYGACDVFVAPMLLPGGIFNKIVDAMAAGRPVVTTSLGNEGVAAHPEEAVLIADDPSHFAHHVLRLMEDDALWRRLALQGRRHVRSVYNWEANVANLESLYARLASSRRRER